MKGIRPSPRSAVTKVHDQSNLQHFAPRGSRRPENWLDLTERTLVRATESWGLLFRYVIILTFIVGAATAVALLLQIISAWAVVSLGGFGTATVMARSAVRLRHRRHEQAHTRSSAN